MSSFGNSHEYNIFKTNTRHISTQLKIINQQKYEIYLLTQQNINSTIALENLHSQIKQLEEKNKKYIMTISQLNNNNYNTQLSI